MNEITPPPASAPPTDEYAPATGFAAKDVEQVRIYEAKAEQKVARDYQHIVWAYGVLWALFAAYGIFLWRRSARLRADMDALQRALEPRA